MKQADLTYFQFFGECYEEYPLINDWYYTKDYLNSVMPPGNYQIIDGELFHIIEGFPPEPEKIEPNVYCFFKEHDSAITLERHDREYAYFNIDMKKLKENALHRKIQELVDKL